MIQQIQPELALGTRTTPDRSKTVLMISYSYPPMGNPGALRVAKFAKYLPEFGWQPVIITPKDGYSPMPMGMSDHVNMPGVQVVRSFDLGSLKRATVAVGGNRVAGTRKSSLANALLIPDRDITWYPFAYHTASNWLQNHPVDAIYSTSPTITNHLVAKRLARQFNLPWVADFRDPWILSTRYRNQGIRRRWEQRIERAILTHADRICVVSETMIDMYSRAYPAASKKIILIRNGYDQADFANLPGPQTDGPFILSYSGMLDGDRRNPRSLFQAMAILKQSGHLTADRFRFQILGKPEAVVVKQANQMGIEDFVEFVGLQPYQQSLAFLARAAAVLLIEMHPENMTTKFYEYLGAQRPILSLMPSDIELAALITRLGVGDVVDPHNPRAIADWLLKKIEVFERQGPEVGVGDESIRQFSRAESAKQLGNVLFDITETVG